LQEAAKIQKDAGLLKRVYDVTTQMAKAARRERPAKDSTIFYEGSLRGITDESKEWWVQGEGVAGFYNACQITGDTHFATVAY
jgi:mannobiose 2-epimerase